MSSKPPAPLVGEEGAVGYNEGWVHESDKQARWEFGAVGSLILAALIFISLMAWAGYFQYLWRTDYYGISPPISVKNPDIERKAQLSWCIILTIVTILLLVFFLYVHI